MSMYGHDYFQTTETPIKTYFLPPYTYMTNLTRDEFRQFIVPGVFYISPKNHIHEYLKIQNIDNDYIELFINPLELGGRAVCFISGKKWIIVSSNLFKDNKIINHLEEY